MNKELNRPCAVAKIAPLGLRPCGMYGAHQFGKFFKISIVIMFKFWVLLFMHLKEPVSVMLHDLQSSLIRATEHNGWLTPYILLVLPN